jgi:hypothetical protein
MAILLVDGIEVFGGNNQALSSIGVSSGGGFVSNGVATTNAPLQNFDLSVLGGLRDSDKYLGRNRVSDIKEAYQTYISGIWNGYTRSSARVFSNRRFAYSCKYYFSD